jgi:hypothetical protein
MHITPPWLLKVVEMEKLVSVKDYYSSPAEC